jgi:hypothetical protein
VKREKSKWGEAGGALKQYHIRKRQVRTIGWVLTALGFAWLLMYQVIISLGPIAGVVVQQRYAILAQKETFTRDEVMKQVLWSVFELNSRLPLVVLPGIIMVLGTVALGVSHRFRDSK